MILIAPDSFKGSLSAAEVAKVISSAILHLEPNEPTLCRPMADGGEGTVDALVEATRGAFKAVQTLDPLGRSIIARYGVLGNGRTVILEVAAASGHALLTNDERDPYHTSTYGTGLLIKHALEAGYDDLIIALGGSVTNDGGAGILQALGARLLDREGKEVAKGGYYLRDIAHIDVSGLMPQALNTSFKVACDVRNPLLGPEGASYVYGPQKGADAQQVVVLDAALANWAYLLKGHSGKEVSDIPGTGAAGGIATVFVSILKGEIVSGFELIARLLELEVLMQEASVIVTGEGKFDSQSLHGKVVHGICKMAEKYQKPVLILAGVTEVDKADLPYANDVSLISLSELAASVEKAMEDPKGWIDKAIIRFLRDMRSKPS